MTSHLHMNQLPPSTVALVCPMSDLLCSDGVDGASGASPLIRTLVMIKEISSFKVKVSVKL